MIPLLGRFPYDNSLLVEVVTGTPRFHAYLWPWGIQPPLSFVFSFLSLNGRVYL